MDTEKMTETLKSRRAEIQAQMQSLVDGAAVSGEDGISFGDTVGDDRSGAVDRMTDQNLHSGLRSELETVDAALAKVDDGSYGACELCGKQIDDNRLTALPWAIHCLDCS